MPEPLAAARRARLGLGLVLATSLLLNSLPIWWGLPSRYGWAPDEIEPVEVLKGSRHGFSGGWTTRYPPLHYYLLAALFSPVGRLRNAGALELDQGQAYFVYFLMGRGLSVLMGTATVFLVYRCGRQLLDRSAAALAALVTALVSPLVYYAKTINLEAPYVFWFTLSLYFYLRILHRQRLRDYLAFAAAAAFSVCTKDQAYALYVLAPVVLVAVLHAHRRRREGGAATLSRTLVDRRILGSGAVAVALFLLIHRLPFDWEGFVHHLREMRRVSAPSSEYANTVRGHLEMAFQAGQHVVFALGLPVALAAALGVVRAARRPRRNAALLSVLVFAVSYYLCFITIIRYHYVRFFIPVCILLSFFAGRALADLARARRFPAPISRGAVAVVLLYSLLRALSVDLLMVADSRYRAEDWLQASVAADEKALGLGRKKMQPRTLPRIDWTQVAARDLEPLRVEDPDYLVVNAGDVWFPHERQIYNRLLVGDLNYRPFVRLRGRPLFSMLDLQGVRTNLDKLTTEFVVSRRIERWGPSPVELMGRIDSLRRGATLQARQQVARAIVEQPIPDRRELLGRLLVVVGGTAQRPIIDRRPAVAVVSNPGREPLTVWMRLARNDPQAPGMITARIDGVEEATVVELPPRAETEVELGPVPARSRRLFIITSDGPGQGGVRILHSRGRRFKGQQLFAAGVTRDGWTTWDRAAVLVANNFRGRAFAPELLLAVRSGDPHSPLTVRLEGGRGRFKAVLRSPGWSKVRLPPIPAHSRQAFLLSSDRHHPPSAANPRGLGIRIAPVPAIAGG